MLPKLNFFPLLTDEYNAMDGFEIRYGCSKSKFGNCIIGVNNEKLCHFAYFDDGKDSIAIHELKVDWPNAILKPDNSVVEPFLKTIFEDNKEPKKGLDILLKGTEFQIEVWKELTNLKSGTTTSYASIAKAIGKPRAIRAVAASIAKNKIAYVIPCHRVIQKSGHISNYRWGMKRKRYILNCENESN